MPNPDAGSTYQMMMTIAYPRAKEIFEQDLASAPVYLPNLVAGTNSTSAVIGKHVD